MSKIKNFFSNRLYKLIYGVELEDVRKESNAYYEKQERLRLMLKNEMEKPSIKVEVIETHVDSWVEYSIEHIYADMQVLKKAFVKMRTLPNVKDIKFNAHSLTYDVIMEKGEASIIVECYKIKLTAWNLSEEDSLKILDYCVDEILKVQESLKKLNKT